MVLEAVLLRGHHVPTLVLSHLDLPLPGGASGPGVNVNVDLVAGVGGGDPHVLASVVATDGGRHSTPWVTNSQGVSGAVSNEQTPFIGICSFGCIIGGWGCDVKGLIINSELANVRV